MLCEKAEDDVHSERVGAKGWECVGLAMGVGEVEVEEVVEDGEDIAGNDDDEWEIEGEDSNEREFE